MVDIPADDTTTANVAVGGSFSDALEVAGDRDWIAVTLTAGTAYDIVLQGSGANPLADPFLRVYDAAGNLVDSNDDGGPGRDALVAGFVPVATGVYYIEAAAFNDAGSGTYKIKVDLAPVPDFLDAIDWGTQVATNVIDVYFAAAGETFDGETSLGWNAYEIQQAMLAFQQIANVAGVTFNVTNSVAGSEFQLVTTTSASYLGYFNPPGTGNEGVGVFARNGTGWDQGEPGTGGLEQGGYGFVTLIHEFGHGMGLAHPHDGGGTSDVWEGVTGSFDSFGTFDLNQGIYTTMSYNDGWQLHPEGENNAIPYGYQGTMMAFDIALLQAKYGANTTFNAGDDVYVLPAANAVGTFFSSLWDTGGIDTIEAGGTGNAMIDLRPAHLGYAAGSGGFISFAEDVYGGFTIANGVMIENAEGGAGKDTITGNLAANRLQGHGGRDALGGLDGDDRLLGQGGVDTLDGGADADFLRGGRGADTVSGGADADTFAIYSTAESATGAEDRILDFAAGEDLLDLSGIDAVAGGGDDALAFLGAAAFSGAAGELRFVVTGTGIAVEADLDGDTVADLAVFLDGLATVGGGDLIL